MATIVRHELNGKRYAYLGMGYAKTKTVVPGMFGGMLNPYEDEEICAKIAVCDQSGKLFWFDSSEFAVVSIDGVAVTELFKMGDEMTHEVEENCPACEAVVFESMLSCPSCGLTLR
ncbi:MULTISPECIES: hypothetical protein [unclassified Fusibacter]|uniref:hypothetical protein n=1 Tax=unclassified Fusibacter TaxID=2624464 RepID=UPI0010121239|nr:MULTISPECIES: hypothetical protein [unclassified Fusibacter]MCK8060117.1 hypothetical protein [Fusibacter sp. A2]NPE22259.1 hypothetical protein [Fusibacter sp. A1]RXV61033.1 hypothetical protein DWB64_10465 [Fusibacter sp. A1]